MLEELQKLGLSRKESEIYNSLVIYGEASANNLAKKTSTNRTVTYNILQQLINKGLVTYIKKQKKTAYRISNPESLVTPIKEKERIAHKLIKQISSINVKKSIENDVEVYEGVDGMRIIFEEIKKAKDLLVINATGLIFNFLKFSAEHIVKEIQLSSRPKLIATQSLKKTPMIKFKNQKVKYLPKEAENYATTFIYNNTTVIQVLKNKPFLIKIVNKEIAEGYRKNFHVLWGKL